MKTSAENFIEKLSTVDEYSVLPVVHPCIFPWKEETAAFSRELQHLSFPQA